MEQTIHSTMEKQEVDNDELSITTEHLIVIDGGDITEFAALKFISREDFLKVAKAFFSNKGYALSIKSSRKDKYITVGCSRGGEYRDRLNIQPEKRQRNTTTRLINCPFEIKGKKEYDSSWKVEIKNDIHNHEASKDMSGFPSARILTKDHVLTIDEMTKSGAPPRQIISVLRRRDPKLLAVSRDIYNTKAKIVKASLGGRSNIQVWFEELSKSVFIFDVLRDEVGYLTHVFFAHPRSIQLSRSYSNVFVMDCTYKTNRYNMPLLEIIGIASFNTSFYSYFIFLKSESLDDYTWALNSFTQILGPNCEPSVIVTDLELALMRAIEIVFPKSANILCVWHIEKNICANCKTHFEDSEGWVEFLSAWNDIVYSSTYEMFETSWNEFEQKYGDKKGITKYIQKTWLPHKMKFISV